MSENSSLGIDILIENTAVLLLDDDFTVVDPGWVAVTGDLIKEVGSGTPPTSVREAAETVIDGSGTCLLYTSPSPRDRSLSRMPSSA